MRSLEYIAGAWLLGSFAVLVLAKRQRRRRRRRQLAGNAAYRDALTGAGALTWSCMVCGDRRPDARIDVHSDVSMIGRIECRSNVRYCNDRAACIAGAPAIAQQCNEAIARSHRETSGG